MKELEEDEVEPTLEEAIEKESDLDVKKQPRTSTAELLEIIKDSLCTCGDCKTNFIKRKEKIVCPICHSKNVSK